MFAYHVQFNPTVPFMFDRDYEKKKKNQNLQNIVNAFLPCNALQHSDVFPGK